MKISLLNERIIIQKSVVRTDTIGNQFSVWHDYFSPFATISSESPLEVTSAGNIYDESKIDFTIRYAREIEEMNSTNYRVIFKGDIYSIKGIDHMNYKKKLIKIHAQRSER